MRPINLIPPEDRRGDRAPLRAGPLAYGVVGLLVVAFAGTYLLVSTGNAISEREAEAAGLEQQLAATQARAEALQSFTGFAQMEQARSETVADLARSRFDWERVMRELALVVSDDVSLEGLQGSVGPGAGGESSGDSGAGSDAGVAAPTLTMTGCASGHESVARLVASLRDIDGVTRVGLGSTEEASADAATAAAPLPAPGVAGEAGGCTDGASFEITVAFDEVSVDAATGGIVQPAPPADIAATDDSGVAQTKAEGDRTRKSADSAEDRAREAVDRYVPGA